MSDKPELQPPSQPRTFAPDPDASRYKLYALIGFSVLALGSFTVVMILPGQLVTPPARVEVTTTESLPARSKEATVEPSTSNATEAQALLQELLTHQARLENEGIRTWGAELLVTSYQEVLALRAEADAHLDDQLFDQAVNGYREAIAKLNQLAASRPERLRRAIQAGNEAFTQLDSQSAKRHYEIALAADAGNQEAQVGLKRVESLPQVLEHIAQGQFHENKDELDLARQRYQSAIALDKDYQSARDHSRRVDQLIQERNFRRSMSVTTSALNRGDVIEAGRALEIAKQLRPDAEGVRDLERQVASAQQRVELQQLRQQALQYEHTEQWEKAAQAYIKALIIDPNTGFAQQGELRTKRSLELNRQVQNYLSHPDDLQAPEHRDHARRLYDQAVASNDMGPILRRKIDELDQLLDEYNKTIPILVQSDDLTDVRINRVGRLGHFLEHRLDLYPGRYKAIGTRSGYRDVSVWFTVPVSGNEVTLRVRCEEEI